MNPFGITLQQLHDAGGWTIATAVLAIMLYGMVKGIVVPRFLYDEQVKRADHALQEQEGTLDSIERLSNSIDMITNALLSGKFGRHE